MGTIAFWKWEGDPWGATITFNHRGIGTYVDVGWAAKFGKKGYLWCVLENVYIPRHNEWTSVSIGVGGIWTTMGFEGTISAQAVVTLGGGLNLLNFYGLTPSGISDKLAEDMKELEPVLTRTYSDVYKTAAEIPWEEFELW